MTEVTKEEFGVIPGQGSVQKWRLKSQSVTVEIISLGCIITSIKTKGRDGEFNDIVLGFDNLQGYLNNARYFGAVIGRVANRIAGGRFTVDGKEYQLAINNGPNTLHGGVRGFDKAIWSCQSVEGGVRLTLISPDGDEGFPGELRATVTYILAEDTLSIQYQACSSKTTPINLTNHSYFNLADHAAPDIYDHEVSITSNAYLPVDENMIPTGEIRQVDGSPFDLREPVLLGPRVREVPGPGFDHNFCLALPGQPWMERACARSGRKTHFCLRIEELRENRKAQPLRCAFALRDDACLMLLHMFLHTEGLRPRRQLRYLYNAPSSRCQA
uniref:Galactose mutarotase n=1 Tax=Paramormyrops kingsleyae TaxID=1676925 RepID=A0A3B3QM12_9TELE